MSSGPRASLARSALPALSAAYALARRSRLLERRWFRRVYTAAYFAYKRHIEDPLAGLLRQQPELVRGGNVADVGAHIGYTASAFCQAIEAPFGVYAFEPDPVNAACLRENLATPIARGQLVVVEAAAGAKSGQGALLRNPSHPGDHRVRTPSFAHDETREALGVAVVSLDDFFATHPEPLAFAKIDVQGYEIEVCRGMQRTLERFPGAVVAFEYSPLEARAMGFDPDDVLRFFRSRGYTLELLSRDGSLEPWDADRVDALVAKRGYAELLCTPSNAAAPRQAR